MKTALRTACVALLVASGAWSGRAQAMAWDFVPTPLEWQIWPEYCRVQYTMFGDPVPYDGYERARLALQQWRSTIGSQTFDAMHHYCAALHFRSRALADTAPNQRGFLFNRAWDDAQYTYRRAEPSSVVFPAISVGVARIRLDMGRPDEAITILQRSIDAQPEALDAYVMLAVVYRNQKRPAEALAIMKKADAIHDGQSAEVQYTLGLINLELGNVDAAVENARQAYSRDYPLGGLRDKLRAQGRWPPPEQKPPSP
jgi:tetratricopeptide (TPR) repeat protein